MQDTEDKKDSAQAETDTTKDSNESNPSSGGEKAPEHDAGLNDEDQERSKDN